MSHLNTNNTKRLPFIFVLYCILCSMSSLRKYSSIKNLILNTVFSKKFFLFIAVGLLNTVFGYLVFAVLFWFNVHYSIAALASTVVGVIFNFNTYGLIVFNNNSYSNFGKFILIYAINYFIGIGILYYFNSLGYNLYIVQALSLLPLALARYFLMKFFVFTKIS
jgi:putative flippase GtrA